jgi:hypothetical protein
MSAPANNLIFQQIPKVMAAVGTITKGRKNAQQGYAFRGIDDVLLAFQKPLSENGLFYVPEVLNAHHDQMPTKSGNVMNYTRLQVAFTIYASDGSNVRGVAYGEASDSADKASNKAMSAALKYFLLHTFCVPAEHDDADQETTEQSDRRPAILDQIKKRFEVTGKTPEQYENWLKKTGAPNKSESWLRNILNKTSEAK